MKALLKGIIKDHLVAENKTTRERTVSLWITPTSKSEMNVLRRWIEDEFTTGKKIIIYEEENGIE